jgi:predicted transcriptional regulator
MPTLSIKLPEETKIRLNQLAVSQGVTSHALMVHAIESALSTAEKHSAFVADALRSRKQTIASGQVLDGAAFAEYLKAKARGLKVSRPKPVRIESLLPSA